MVNLLNGVDDSHCCRRFRLARLLLSTLCINAHDVGVSQPMPLLGWLLLSASDVSVPTLHLHGVAQCLHQVIASINQELSAWQGSFVQHS